MASSRPRRATPPRAAAVLTPAEARAWLVGHHALSAPELPPGAAGVRALVERLRCIQLDPLDPLGTNADLVALARVDGIARGDVYRHLLPGHAFEHFAKERCLLPARAFPWYRAELAIEAPWWSHAERLRRLPRGVVEKVLEEVRARGPVAADDLADHGRVEPLDWSGWRGTPRAAKMALEVLQTRCDVVVSGRGPRGKVYDVPERALPDAARARAHPPGRRPAERVEAFRRWALLERVEAAGFLARAAGATWSMLDPARRAGVPDALLAEGAVEEVQVAGSPRTYLAPRGFAERRRPRRTGGSGCSARSIRSCGIARSCGRRSGFEYAWRCTARPTCGGSGGTCARSCAGTRSSGASTAPSRAARSACARSGRSRAPTSTEPRSSPASSGTPARAAWTGSSSRGGSG